MFKNILSQGMFFTNIDWPRPIVTTLRCIDCVGAIYRTDLSAVSRKADESLPTRGFISALVS